MSTLVPTLAKLLLEKPQPPYYINPQVANLDYLSAIATLQEFCSRNSVTPDDANIQSDLARLLAHYNFTAITFNHQGITNTLFLRLGTHSKLATSYQQLLKQPWLVTHPQDPKTHESLSQTHVVAWQNVLSQYQQAQQLVTSSAATNSATDSVASSNTYATTSTTNTQSKIALSESPLACLSDLPIFCIAGHTDVVPPGNLATWTFNEPFASLVQEQVSANPFSPIKDLSSLVSPYQGQSLANLIAQESGRLAQAQVANYLGHPERAIVARGTTDMKGGLVAGIFALTALVEKYQGTDALEQVSLAFLLTSDEEGVAHFGTKYVVEELEKVGQGLEWCIIAEPSSSKVVGDTIRNGRRGSASWWLTMQGEQGHVAYPHLVDNPIHRLIPILNELQAELLNLDQGNSEFPATSFQLVELQAGDGTTNIVPSTAKAQFNIRFNNLHSYASLQEVVNKVLARFPEDAAKLTVSSTCSGESFVTPQETAFCQDAVAVISRLTNGQTIPKFDTGGGTSDGRFITRICPQMFELGTTNATLHKVNEHITLGEFYSLMQFFYGIAAQTLGLVQVDTTPTYKATTDQDTVSTTPTAQAATIPTTGANN